ncbi:MAG: hypothetical protein GF333_01885 [Candidatus Omnitrophica bacterium]|nr:hypothetical protein [Candidatus Omnitrophota bacterium]
MIKEISIPKVKNPIFIAAWPGMGEVAYRTALFLKEVLNCKMFAKLEAQKFFRPAAVTVDKGVIELPRMPAGFFYYGKGKNLPDVILFLGEAQPPLEYAEDLAQMIVTYAKKYKAQFLYTFAAKPESIDHKSDPRVWIAATHQEILGEFKSAPLKHLEEGQISGLNGIVLGAGKRKGLKGVCLLGEVPFYTVQIENPKTCAKILQIIGDKLDLHLNIAPLMERAKFIEEEVDKLINYIKGETPSPAQGPMPLSEDDIDRLRKDLATYSKLPQSARNKIESLFRQAKKDVAKAGELKSLLDQWNVYKEYEDRFLDLFKKGKGDQSN